MFLGRLHKNFYHFLNKVKRTVKVYFQKKKDFSFLFVLRTCHFYERIINLSN